MVENQKIKTCFIKINEVILLNVIYKQKKLNNFLLQIKICIQIYIR